MIVESQVCSQALAIRLKELGVKQKSLFYWRSVLKDGSKWIVEYKPDRDFLQAYQQFYYSAFTVAELGHFFEYSEDPYLCFHSHRNSEGWNVNVETDDDYFTVIMPDEVDARAKMLIHLLENNLLGGSHV